MSLFKFRKKANIRMLSLNHFFLLSVVIILRKKSIPELLLLSENLLCNILLCIISNMIILTQKYLHFLTYSFTFLNYFLHYSNIELIRNHIYLLYFIIFIYDKCGIISTLFIDLSRDSILL